MKIQPTAEDPLADVDTPQDLERVIDQAEQMLEQCELHPEGFDHVVGKDKEGNAVTREIDSDEVPKIKVWAHRLLFKHAPAREKFLAERAKHDTLARDLYPEMFRADSPEREQVMQLISLIPEVLRAPTALLDLGRYIAGYRLEQERLTKTNGKSNANGKSQPNIEPFTRPQPPIAPSTTKVRGDSSAPASTTIENRIKAARERLEGEDTEEAAEDLIGARLGLLRQTGGREPTLS